MNIDESQQKSLYLSIFYLFITFSLTFNVSPGNFFNFRVRLGRSFFDASGPSSVSSMSFELIPYIKSQIFGKEDICTKSLWTPAEHLRMQY